MPEKAQERKRPTDVIGNAVHVCRIATGEVAEAEDKAHQPNKAKGGRIGGQKRAESLSPKRRREIAKVAAQARWARQA